MLHEPCRRVGFRRIEAEARSELASDGGAGDRVVLRPPLGDVVQEHRHVERAAVAERAHDAVRQRVLVAEAAGLDFRQHADGADEVLVHRVVVVHVELHHRDDAAEIRG
jgi:hypothetical protein